MSTVHELVALIPLLAERVSNELLDLKSPELVEPVLNEWLGINQTQIAALIGLSPQAVSKGFRDDGLMFLSKDKRLFRLHSTLTAIGGDRYLPAAAKLREFARVMAWGNVPSHALATTTATDLYAESEELWIVSDSPSDVVDWGALKEQMYSPQREQGERLTVFFMRTLEAAERWAEVLEREFITPAVVDFKIEADKSAKARQHFFIIVSNIFVGAQDYVISNPGSRCMGISSSNQRPMVYFWTGSEYVKSARQNLELLDIARMLDLGTGTLKIHFFPRGFVIRSEVFNFWHRYLDGMIAIRGSRLEEDPGFFTDDGRIAEATGWEDKAGTRMVGGLLASVSSSDDNSLTFNKRAKYCPVFICVYKRRPGESFNTTKPNGIRKALQAELDSQREELGIGREEGAHTQPVAPERFW